jgi:cyclohexadieny/prephenate dehydrogenase
MATPSPAPAAHAFSTVAIVGVGLIGGSIGTAVKARGVAHTVIGLGRNRERLEAARHAGLIDRVATDGAGIADADLIVVCTPVDRISTDIVALALHAKPGAVFTDAGSVKGTICSALRSELPAGPSFVGSHPLAGSEKAGFEHADADLFTGKVCVLTPDDSTPPTALSRVRLFWQALGMRVVEMSPERHDAVLALTSHLPHAAAAALASLLDPPESEFAASGFRDTTRVAGGDPDLWSAIFSANREPVAQQLDRLIAKLTDLRNAIAADDRSRVSTLLSEAKQRRDQLG